MEMGIEADVRVIQSRCNLMSISFTTQLQFDEYMLILAPPPTIHSSTTESLPPSTSVAVAADKLYLQLLISLQPFRTTLKGAPTGMSRAAVALGRNKRPRESSRLTSDEQSVLDLILSKEGSGIQPRSIKFQLKIPDPIITRATKTLLANGKIKEVNGVQRGGATPRKTLMGVDFKPADVVSGGFWYENGKIDTGFVDVLRRFCRMQVMKSKVATLEWLHKAVMEGKLATVEIPRPQLTDLLTSMVLDNELVEVKSTGFGAFFRIPIGETCYKLPSSAAGGAGKDSVAGKFASIPCGVCPRIDVCTPDGAISPTTCVYYSQWLDIKF
ncbi:DNA-directed RNA polymerase III subunit rpc6-like [Salvia divinorum]|uniref:DNA-directed RNA polymerase III subunit rpc6-like n=1 Tax=Salvia divinorum TaxID=28513 RepID=A0ABD1FKE8_SALDI